MAAWFASYLIFRFTEGPRSLRVGVAGELAALALLAAGLRLVEFGGSLRVEARKLRALDAWNLLRTDPRPPILYLRSFGDDEKRDPKPRIPARYGGIRFHLSGLPRVTQEEALAKAAARLGPFIAVGDPSDTLPDLGAARLYCHDAEWRSRVSDLMSQAALVLFRPGSGAGFWWEVAEARRLLPAERVVFWLPPPTEGGVDSRKEFEDFCEQLREYLQCRCARWEEGARFLVFDPGWTLARVSVPVRRWGLDDVAGTLEDLVQRAHSAPFMSS